MRIFIEYAPAGGNEAAGKISGHVRTKVTVYLRTIRSGDNIQATDNLSAEVRQNILRQAIEEKQLSVNDILNLLEMQIHLHSGKENYGNVVKKWKEDSDFVKGYGIESGRKKRITSLKA